MNLGKTCREKLFDFFCVVPEFVAGLIKDTITSQADQTIEFAKDQIRFNVTVNHTVESKFETHATP